MLQTRASETRKCSYMCMCEYLPIALIGSATTVTKRSDKAKLVINTESSFLNFLNMAMASNVKVFPPVPTTEAKTRIRIDGTAAHGFVLIYLNLTVPRVSLLTPFDWSQDTNKVCVKFANLMSVTFKFIIFSFVLPLYLHGNISNRIFNE